MHLIGIAGRASKSGPMTTFPSSMVTRVAGIEHDSRGKPGKRQVTVMSIEQWQAACGDLKGPSPSLPWTTRRANLLISGYEFSARDVGKQIKIGPVILYVTGETDPCHKMNVAQAGLMQALTPNWRGGVCCKVLSDGRISLNDPISIV